jgi:hypothetical protein
VSTGVLESLAPPPNRRFTLRWRKVWETEDGRGNVQAYNLGRGVRVYDAWYDRRHLGQRHRAREARALVLDAASKALKRPDGSSIHQCPHPEEVRALFCPCSLADECEVKR